MRLWHRWVAAIAIGAVGLAAWAGAGRAQAPKAQWVVAIGEEGESLDPPTSMLFTSEIYQQHLFDCLVGIEGEEFKPVGLLAEKWETINPTTWRFHLRKGVKFHNGKPLDAEDVKYSFEQYAGPEEPPLGLRAAASPGSRSATPSTVDLITSEPVSALLFNLTRLQILPKETREKAGVPAFAQQPVGTGPYRFVEWKRDQQLVLEANPTYWRGPVNPKRLVFRAIRDASTRAAELRSGGVDIVAAPPVPQLEMLDSGDTQVVPVKGGRIIIYPFNVSAPAVRQPEGPRGREPGGQQGRDRQERARQPRHRAGGAVHPGVARLRPEREAVPLRPRAGQAAPGRGRLPPGPRHHVVHLLRACS